MSSGVHKRATGSVAGTGSAIIVDVVGFRPRKVELYNVDGDAIGIWTDTMPDASMMKTVAAGTTAQVTTGGVTPRAAGFSIGADADVNAAGEAIHWVAEE